MNIKSGHCIRRHDGTVCVCGRGGGGGGGDIVCINDSVYNIMYNNSTM